MDTFYHILPEFTRGKLPHPVPIRAETHKKRPRQPDKRDKPYSSTQSPASPCPAEKQGKAEVSCYQKKGAPTL